jgi:hypothetical protein
MWERSGEYRVLVGRPEDKRHLGGPQRRWKDITMDLQEIDLGAVDWIDLAQDRGMW